MEEISSGTSNPRVKAFIALGFNAIKYSRLNDSIKYGLLQRLNNSGITLFVAQLGQRVVKLLGEVAPSIGWTRIYEGKEPIQFLSIFQSFIIYKGGISAGYILHSGNTLFTWSGNLTNASNQELVKSMFMEYWKFDLKITMVANSGWVLEKGNCRSELIALPRNEFNQHELRRNTADGIPLEHVTRIFGVLV
ncbi:Eukaryotic translation initiation factor 3 subunit K [Platanthera guangdongensis]|uniref:Eukaryotic translation initiation factor 3 subunit K n=1 Tax=Platanthera guangdongensis TaxID=2320717 RepID=A0ABR2N4T5_9ASPA